MNDITIILLGLLGTAGATIIFVGNIFSLITTFGISRNWGIAALFVPLLSIAFCIYHRERASYPLKLIASGLAMLSCALLIRWVA